MANSPQSSEQPIVTMSTLGNYGRFGNQITQYAFLKIYAKEHGFSVETPGNWVGHSLFGKREQSISRQLPRIQQSSQDPQLERLLNTHEPLQNIDIQGYFQYHTSFYAQYKNYFRSLFKPLPEIEAPLLEALKYLRTIGKTLVGLHLRRGDYGYKHFFVAPNAWYLAWLERIWQEFDQPVLFIASDEPEKVVDDFRAYAPITLKDLGITTSQAAFYPDFYILSQCDITAISNSSFSFTACMLNERGKYFLRPSLTTQSLIEFDPWDSEIVLTDKSVEEFELPRSLNLVKELDELGKTAVNLPIHFLTMVLNGEPFVRYHIEVFQQLNLQWHWHIVEGVIAHYHDNGWIFPSGESVPSDIHLNRFSNDGTSQYIDQLTELYPDNITIYRKPDQEFWDGKHEMMNSCLVNIPEECLLWQIDVDELWTVEQIHTVHRMFQQFPEKTAAFYWCWFFVGEQLVISTSYCYTQDPEREWLRTWRFRPGMIWSDSEPPQLMELTDHGWQDVGSVNPFLHQETEMHDLIFQHFAYVTLKQLQFKQKYNGYSNATSGWQQLQSQDKFPLLLSQYFDWVQDQTTIDTAQSCGIVPIAYRDPIRDVWRFLDNKELSMSESEIDLDFEYLHLHEINLIIFPDWTQKQEFIAQDLTSVLQAFFRHPQRERMTLLVNTSSIHTEQADEILTEVVMNLLMQDDLEFAHEPQISLVADLTSHQWQALLEKVQARIALEHEDKIAIASVAAENIPSYSIEEIASLELLAIT